MAVSFGIPASPKKSIMTIDEFLGVDFTNSPTNVDLRRSPNAVNMIRDVPGKVRKCMGWEVVQSYEGLSEVFSNPMEGAVVITGAVNDYIKDFTIYGTLQNIGDGSKFIPLGNINDIVIDWTNTESVTFPSSCLGGGLAGVGVSDDYEGATYTDPEDGSKSVCDTLNPMTCTITRRITSFTYEKGMTVNEPYASSSPKGLVAGATIYTIKEVPTEERIYPEGIPTDITYEWMTYEGETEVQVTGSSRTGVIFSITYRTPNNINGYHYLRSKDKAVIHISSGILDEEGNLLYSGANDFRSKSWEFEDRLYIIDGKKMLVFHAVDEEDPNSEWIVEPVENVAYIPLLTISKDPNGGGTPYEDLNMLTPAFTESFLGKADVKEYQLSFDGLDAREPKVEVLNKNGVFKEKVFGTDYSVDYTTGTITFTTAPGVSPVSGEDNVRITAYRTVDDYADRINKCTIGTLFGVNGALDRLFLSGNPDYINYDWYSGQYDPTYFEDTAYSKLGSDSSAIVGYSIISNYLATHKDDMEKDQNIILRQGDLMESEPVFRIVNTLQGAGAISKDSFAYLSTEPLFLTKLGIYAVTAQDITGEKYAQNRSFYLNGKLLEEPNLEKAFGFVYKDMYWLCLNNVAYILDGLQPLMTDKSMPYATRQYAGFYRTNLPANIMWERDGVLYFGTKDGRICRFHTDKYQLSSYNDDGRAIEAIWETPDLDGQLFYKNKTVRYLAVRLESAIATSISVYAMVRGIWNHIKTDDSAGRYLTFSQLTFSKLSFSCDKTPRIASTKMRIKKVDKFRLRLKNDALNEPFGLFDIAVEFTESGNFKG